MYDGFLTESILKRAIEKKLVEINIINFRDFSKDPHQKVDDTPYGGGNGMVLMVQPIYDCLMSIKTEQSKVILLTPEGTTYHQKMAYDLSKEKHLILICGHYEGFDERIKNLVDLEISVGDFILTGGEIPSMIVVDSVIRLVKGVIQEESHQNDSFHPEKKLLDYPTYTKPREFEGMVVPEILLNGDHKKIEEYRHQEALKKTEKYRPDLLKK